MTAPVVFGRLHLLPVVLDFLRAYPQINVRLQLADRVVHLLDDHIDLALRIGELPDSRMVASRVGEVRRVVCASPDYLKSHGRPGTPQDLSAHSCISFQQLTESDDWIFNAGGKTRSPSRTATVTVHPRLTVNTAEAALDAAIAGLGITRVLSYQMEIARRSNALEIILEDYEPNALPVSLVYPSQGVLALKTRAFLDFVRPALEASLAGKPGNAATISSTTDWADRARFRE